MSTSLDDGFLSLPLSVVAPDSQDFAGDALTLLFDELSHGVVVISEQRRILHINDAARRELARCGVLQACDGELEALSPIDGNTLQAALLKAAAGKRCLLRLNASGISLTLSVVPLRQDHGGAHDRIALFFARTGLNDSGTFASFARSHGLTPTEEQVLAFLCNSLSTPEIAARMKVAVSTVRSHVRSVCAKTLSSGVRELLHRIAMLPPVGLVTLP
jgi:DNA-binding CsgD family transcriptional regulator